MGFDPMCVTTKRILRNLGGDKETKVITYDGNGVGSEIVEGGGLFVKISDEPANLENVTSVTITDKKGEQFTTRDLKVANTEDGVQFIPFADSAALVMSIPIVEGAEDLTGLYFLSEPASIYVSSITFETIHPIDPKFLGVIEVFNLPDYGIDLLSMLIGGQKELAHDNTAFITDATNAIAAGKIAVVRIDDMLNDAIITAFFLAGEVEFSLCGSMGDSWLRVTVMINDSHIRMFTTALE